MTSLDDKTYREALGSFPSGVTIVTTTDEEGRHWGFTASSFTSVSMNPRLVLVCLAQGADSHPVFIQARQFSINVLALRQKDVALHFSRKNVDKFADQDFQYSNGDEHHPPALRGASATLVCEAHDAFHLGDHLVLVGQVTAVERESATPLVYCNRDFWALEPAVESVA